MLSVSRFRMALVLALFCLVGCAAPRSSVAPISPTLPIVPAATRVIMPQEPTLLPFTPAPKSVPTALPTSLPTAIALPTALPPTALPTPVLPSDLNDRNHIMTEQLVRAAAAGKTATVQQLLQEGADINDRDALGRTPVMAATHANQVDMVRLLIQAGADINIRDNRMDNPFLYAGAEGLFDILKLTIAAGADTKLTNRFGGTALIPACERGHVAIVRELLTTTDVDVNHVNNLGWTALLEAIVLSDGGERHQQIVQLLLDHGADITIADKDGVTPLMHAQRRGYTKIVELLQK